MLIISEEYLYSRCEIKTLANNLIATGSLTNILQEGIQVTNSSEILPILHCNTQVKIGIYDDNSEFKVLVGKVFLSTPDMIRFSDIQSLADFEHRNFFRLRVNINAKACLIKDDNPDKKHSFDITVTNLSLSGCFITTQQTLALDQIFVTTIVLYEVSIDFRCQMQREQSLGSSLNGYGCSFLDDSNRQFDTLCKYLFERQREQIKNSKSFELF